MVPIASLWLPIVVSAVLVFVASSIIWMALPIHKKDYKKLGANEDRFMELVRSAAMAPGMYMYPACDPSTMKNNPEAQAKFKEGPWGTFNVMSKPWGMGKMLGMWMFNLLLITTLVAYIAGTSLPPGASFGMIARLVATAALLGYGGSLLTDSIWKGRPWSLFPGALFDAVVYAALTAAVFGYLLPKAL